MGITDNLNKIMELTGITQRELELKSKVHDSRISEIRNGKTKNPQMKTIKKLSEGLGLSIDYLTSDDSIISEQELDRRYQEAIIAAVSGDRRKEKLPATPQMKSDGTAISGNTEVSERGEKHRGVEFNSAVLSNSDNEVLKMILKELPFVSEAGLKKVLATVLQQLPTETPTES